MFPPPRVYALGAEILVDGRVPQVLPGSSAFALSDTTLSL